MFDTLKQEAEKLLANVPDEYVFRCCDGRVLKNTKELGESLTIMTDETFACHSNAEKSDFANWVRDIIKDEKLAKDLQGAPNRTWAAKRVNSRIAILTKRLT